MKTKFVHVFRTHTSDGGGVSSGDFGIDLNAKIGKPTPFMDLVKKDLFIYLKVQTHSYLTHAKISF